MDIEKSIREGQIGAKLHTAKQFDFSNEVSNDIQKGSKFPIGTIHNGYKKVGEGDWRKVSSEGKTKQEHEKEAQVHREKIETANKTGKGEDFHYNMGHRDKHKELASKTDDKQYSDEDVMGGKEEKVGDLKVGDLKVGDSVEVNKDSDIPTSLVGLSGKIVGTENGTTSVPLYAIVETSDGEKRSVNPNYLQKK